MIHGRDCKTGINAWFSIGEEVFLKDIAEGDSLKAPVSRVHH